MVLCNIPLENRREEGENSRLGQEREAPNKPSKPVTTNSIWFIQQN